MIPPTLQQRRDELMRDAEQFAAEAAALDQQARKAGANLALVNAQLDMLDLAVFAYAERIDASGEEI